MTTENKVWGIGRVWNEALAGDNNRKYEPRERLWASELDNAPIDTWLKLKGVKPTNPPNARSRRKFEAGNIWEWLVAIILQRAGILISQQDWVAYQYPGLLKVTGKLDYIAGGKPNFDRAFLEQMELPPKIIKAGESIVQHLEKNYPNGLETRIIEMKSTSSFMFDKMKKDGRPSTGHELQLFHYLKAKDMQKGSILYVCKDDCRMIEMPVFNSLVVEEKYKKAIETITKYHQEDKQPPLEKPIEFNGDRFTKNWKIEYSGYLTKLYGFKEPKDFYEKYAPIISSWNRVLTRMEDGKDMTESNKEKLVEIEKAGFDIEKIKGQLLTNKK